MAEGSRLDREYRRLVNDMNVQLVDENLYVRSLRNREIPYNTRLNTFDNQIAKHWSQKSHLGVVV